MPIYEYQCDDCSSEFEKLILAGLPEAVRCPACGGDRATKMVSSFALGRSGRAESGPRASSSPAGSCCAGGGCSCHR